MYNATTENSIPSHIKILFIYQFFKKIHLVGIFRIPILKNGICQNITRDIEVKNNLTIARGEWGGDSGEKGFQEIL